MARTQLMVRFVALTNFSRRQPEYDGEPPYIWQHEDISPAQIEALGWTDDEIELYIGQGALLRHEEYIEIPEPPAPKPPTASRAKPQITEQENEVNDGSTT